MTIDIPGHMNMKSLNCLAWGMDF